MIGPEKAPKIVGMIIELPQSDLENAMREWKVLEEKVAQGLDLLDKKVVQW